jgi:hypothetical protein
MNKINDLYYKFKIKTNKLFWKKVFKKPFIIEIYSELIKPFETMKPDFIDDKVNKSYEYDCKKWFHDSFIYKIKKKVLIEPDYGYIVYGLNRIIAQSMIYKELYPSLIKRLLKKKNIVHLDKAIIFDGNVGSNYFHFFSDLINKIWVYDKYGIDKSLPLIIGEKIFNYTYFQYFYNNTDLRNRNWYVLKKNIWIKSSEVYISRPMPYSKDLWIKTLNLLNINNNNANKRVFLTRSKDVGRYILNMDEIIPILNEFDFETYDTNLLSFAEQFALFSKIKYLISIHGAGETNICFSYKNNLNFIEINPENRIACHYYWLSAMLGYNYDIIMGGNLERLSEANEGGFYLSPDKLKNAIKRMIE